MRHGILIGLSILVAGCTAGGSDDSDTIGDPSAMTTGTGADPARLPGDFAETAWRTISSDGARFITYLDRDGTYRDLRNGDPWQTGQWTFNATGDGRLCFTPDAEGGVERCWKPSARHDKTMEATGPGDRQIELQRVDYVLPQVEDETEA